MLQVNVRFDYSDANTVETGAIEVWDGLQWIVLWASTTADVNEKMTFDVTSQAANNPGFRVRFDYQDAALDNFFSVDDVTVITDVIAVCNTAASGPASVPRGSLSTVRNGAGIDLTWDAATCSTANYNLLYGDLANVSTYALQGSVCGLGSGGSFSWAGPPAGNLYFIVVSTDGAVTEGSWGLTRTFAERNGLEASDECGVSVKNPTNICE
jgi:hypothetical protein